MVLPGRVLAALALALALLAAPTSSSVAAPRASFIRARPAARSALITASFGVKEGEKDNLDIRADKKQKTEADMPTPGEVPGFWELEEAEDDCTMRTLIHLVAGGDVQFGTTDGPVPEKATGSWRIDDEKSMKIHIRLMRHFDGWDTKYPYDVERVYEGYVETDGPLILAQGPIEIEAEGRERIDAGYFTLTHVPPPPDQEAA